MKNYTTSQEDVLIVSASKNCWYSIPVYCYTVRPIPSLSPQAPCPDVYRGEHRDPETAGHLYALEVKRMIEEAQSKGKKVCFGI